MIGTRITQEYRVECDGCGAGATMWFADLQAARDNAAARSGYVYSSWLQDGRPREFWLCPECYRQAKLGARAKPSGEG